MDEPPALIEKGRSPDAGNTVRLPGHTPGQHILSGVVGFIGWLASSLGVISAIFYASGFLISAAHLRLLGLGQIMTYSHEHYVQQGGEFVRYIAAYCMEAALLLIVVIVGVLLLPILLASLLSARVAWVQKLLTLIDSQLGRGFGYVVLFLALGLWGSDPQTFEQPLSISNLLFINADCAQQRGSGNMVDKFLCGDTKALAAAFEHLLLPYFFVFCLFIISFFVTQTWATAARRWAVAPFAVVLLLYTILLTMDFGVLMVPLDFPTVEVRVRGDQSLQLGSSIFLLNKSDKEFIFFDADHHKLIWLPHDSVERIEVNDVGWILKQSASKARQTP